MAVTKAPVSAIVTDTPTIAAETYDPWRDMREIELPPAPRGEADYFLIGINGAYTRVKRGAKVKVPYPVYERIQIIRQKEQEEYEYLKSIDDTNTNIADGGQM